ncbi:hypothetical protein MPLSOD_140293 [Mesorhizobium sp. SOD10]|nr:hypothetical protein MPLSOD_140293 [Mesorhizobium sp. SOD10]
MAALLGVVIATVAASSLLGWLISRWRILPGTTAVWGSSPGAATAMVLMAGAFGADQRLVAFMQYLRVIFVSMTAALVAKMWVDTSGVEVPPVVWFPPIDAFAFAASASRRWVAWPESWSGCPRRSFSAPSFSAR